MNITKKLYVIISTIIILFFVLKLLIINKFFFVLEYFDLVFFFLVFLFFFLFYGKPRNKNYLKKISVRYMIVLLLSYVLIIYLFGFFMGFTKSIYSFNLLTILGNIIPVGLAIFFKEYTRFIVANKSFNHIGPYVLLTIFYISITIFNSYINTDFNNLFQIFNFICLSVFPTIAKETVSSYLTYEISYVPTLIYNLSFAVAQFVFPIFPNLGDYLNSVLGILFPFIIFLSMRKIIKYHDKDNIKLTGTFIKLICIPLVIFLTVLILLISGVFSYKLIAIGSDSMNPIYYKGDAVIYQKTDINDIKVNDILVFSNNSEVITHRVKNIIKKGNKVYFQTKGDNNKDVDVNLVESSNVLGTVKYIVKYVGYPTVFINEFFKG